MTGYPIQPYAARVLEELGGDASNFAARQLKPTIAEDADLVLTMTRAHRDDVLKLAPQQLHRTFTLREAARLASECSARNVPQLAEFRPLLPAQEESDIPDPIGQDEAFFAMYFHLYWSFAGAVDAPGDLADDGRGTWRWTLGPCHPCRRSHSIVRAVPSSTENGKEPTTASVADMS
jgi:protein-tyrosine phosphatase